MTLELSSSERQTAAGNDGAAMAMRIVADAARLLGARRLIPIRSAHIDGAVYHGDSGVHFAEKLVAGGARVSVPSTLNVGTISGGLNINSVPDGATFGIDIRTIPAQDHGQIIASLQTFLGEGVQLTTLLDVPALWTDPNTPWIQEVYAVTAAIIQEQPVVRTTTYFTDASALTPAFGHAPTIILGPGEGSMAHQTDEYCYVERIHQAVKAYTEIARRWC